MDKNPSTGRHTSVSVISLNDKRVIASVFRGIRHTTAAHKDLRRQIFSQIAKSTKLQHMLLDVLSRHADVEKLVLQELAKNAQLKRKLVVVAHERQKSQVPSGSRKKSKNS